MQNERYLLTKNKFIEMDEVQKDFLDQVGKVMGGSSGSMGRIYVLYGSAGTGKTILGTVY